MRFAFHYRQPFTKQLALLDALKEATARAGDDLIPVEGFQAPLKNADALILFGIGGHSREVFDAYQRAGKGIVFFDKGYTRGLSGSGFLRVAVNEFQPLRWVQGWSRPPDRFVMLRLQPQLYKTNGSHILLDGASNKFCIWQSLGEWIAWGESMVRKIREHSDLPIIYRPRPSHNGAVAVAGAELSQIPLREDLGRARVVVSYGGNIGFDCVLGGVPHFAIGDSVARPLSETDWSFVDRPRIPTWAERDRWLHNLAYCQWTLDEIANGKAWKIITGELR